MEAQQKTPLHRPGQWKHPQNEPIRNDGRRHINPRSDTSHHKQPYLCRRCGVDHTSNCPKWEEEKKREALIKNLKEENTKTIIVGDSNLKLVNSDAILADVICSSGAKVGHINNILKTENLEKYENIVVLAGVNNIPSAQVSFEDNAVFDQAKEEMEALRETFDLHVNVLVGPGVKDEG